MKKLFVCIALMGLMISQGCILMSEGYYSAQQEEWKARKAAASAYNSQIEAKLVEVDPATGRVVVYNQNQAEPMVIPQKENAFVKGANVVLNSAVGKLLGGGWAAGYFASNLQGNISNSGDGNIDITERSNNAFENNHAEENSSVSQDDSTDSSVNENWQDDNSDNRVDDNSDNRTNYDNQTADPTIVNPEVVTQPDPVIVDQTTP